MIKKNNDRERNKEKMVGWKNVRSMKRHIVRAKGISKWNEIYE
jgi:hypothetical protein